jgi:alpha-L-fucosidase
MFKAELFDPNEWAQIFQKSGAKYIVLTTKHHEGYCLWPNKHSPGWNAGEVGPHRDLVGDLAKSIRSHNLTFGIYHSLLEWYHPLYMQDKANKWATHEFVKTKVRPSLEELVNTYHPSLIWSDGEWEAPDTYWNSTDFIAWLYNESPVKDTVVVNDRWGSNTMCKHGGYLNCQDKYLPKTKDDLKRKFETCLAMDLGSWGYAREANAGRILTINQLLEWLTKVVSYGGNFLINVGPRSDGRIDPLFEERLTQLGEWLKVNGEAIYESKHWDFQEDPIFKEVFYTQRDGHVYGIVNGYHPQIDFGAIAFDSIKSIHLLGNGEAAVPHERIAKSGTAAHDHVLVRMPNLAPDSPAKWAYVFRFELK